MDLDLDETSEDGGRHREECQNQPETSAAYVRTVVERARALGPP